MSRLRPNGEWQSGPLFHVGDRALPPGEALRPYAIARECAEVIRLADRALDEGADWPPADDVVHFDFQGSNILVDRDQVSGVVDWDGCRAGDRAFDLATLLFYADEDDGGGSGPRERLWRVLVARTSPSLLGIYLAHLVLRQVDWSIRFHDRSTVERWLDRADDALRRLSVATEDAAGA